MSLRLLAGLLLAVALGAGGCAGAGFAAVGPLFTTIQMVADRSVERALPADLVTAWATTVDTLARMAIHVHETDKSGESWALEATGETVTVRAQLQRVTPRMTRLSLRVEAGKLLADKKTAEEILNQVALSLNGVAAGARGASVDHVSSSEALAALQREVERLSSKLEETRKARHRPAEPPAPAPVTLSGAPIIVVPASLGVPSAPAVESMSGPQPVGSVLIQLPASPPAERSAVTNGLAPGRVAVDDVLAALLRPVEALKPVEGLAIRGSGQ